MEPEDQENKEYDAEDFKGVQAHETVYGGIRIEREQKEQLQNQPASDFIVFEPRRDGSFNMRYKLPEMGSVEGNEFKLRENINYFTRGIARYCLDANGNIDLSRFDKFEKVYNRYVGAGEASSPGMAELLSVPEEKQADFRRFMAACPNICFALQTGFELLVDDLEQFQTALSDLYKPGQPVDKDREELLMSSYGDFMNKAGNLSKLAYIKPAEETKTYYYQDCGYSADNNRIMLGMVNEYRQNHGQPIIAAPEDTSSCEQGKLTIDIAQKRRDDPENGNYISFKDHACFVLKANLNGKDAVLSFETTAPPAGKLLFSNHRGETAMGVYKDTEELTAFHQKDSIMHVKNMKAYSGIKEINSKVFSKNTAIKGSFIMETKLRCAAKSTSHNMEELGKRLSSRQVDHPLITSSKQFKAMKHCFQDLKKAKTPDESRKAMYKLNIATQLYLDYKDPKHDTVKAGKLSDYAKERIKIARDILEFTSAELNKAGEKIQVISELDALGQIKMPAGKAPSTAENSRANEKKAEANIRSEP